MEFSSAIPLKATILNKEKLVGAPVSFYMDRKGDLFITLTERYRRQKEFGGVVGNGEQLWLAYYDNAFIKPWDLKEFYLSQLGDSNSFFAKFSKNVDAEEFTKYKERIIKLTPEGEKKVLFEGLNSIGEGPVAGIVKVGNKVWVTSIPNLWKFDYNKKEEKLINQNLFQDGFGVHLGWAGHALHGLILGPDGRIYFTSADKGAVFFTKEGNKIDLPHTGAVFRMEQDGSNLEVFAIGLRNPEELTFDNYGNLFTGDNNADSGDKARLVHILEGSHSGWFLNYQSLKQKYLWVGEGSEWGCQPHNNGKDYKYSARILPATGEFGWGPSGISYYPGLGLGKEYINTFFLANYPKEIRVGRVKKKGASFVVDKQWSFIRGANFSDVDFGYDSNLYALDWGISWKISDKGRILRYEAKNLSQKEKKAIIQVKDIFMYGIDKKTNFELLSYLGHEHKKLREESLHELVKRNVYDGFVKMIKNSRSNEMAKIHALWGVERIARLRNKPELVNIAQTLFKDLSFQVRAQAIKVFGEVKNSSQNNYFKNILARSSEDAIVLYNAVLSLAKLADKTAVSSIIKAIEKNDDKDIALRHGFVYALYNIERINPGQLKKYYRSNNISVRLALVLALRSLKSKDLMSFLNDNSIQVQAEVIRAIYETRIGLISLARKLKQINLDERIIAFKPLLLRILYANFIVGAEEQVNDILSFLTNKSVRLEYKEEAFKVLKQWLGDYSPAKSMSNIAWGESPREPLFGFTLKVKNSEKILQILKKRREELEKFLPKNMAIALNVFYDKKYFNSEENLKKELLAEKFPFEILIPFIRKYSKAKQNFFYSLAYKGQNINNKVFAGIELINLDWNKNIDKVFNYLSKNIQLLQLFIKNLKNYSQLFYIKVLKKILNNKNLPKEVYLDILNYTTVQTKLRWEPIIKKYLASDEEKKLKMTTLYGGEVKKGEDIFNNHPIAQCLRCHAVNGKGGLVGPDLGQIGKFKSREYLLESLIYPSRHFAKGFANESIQLKNGKTISGILDNEDGQKLVIKIYGVNKLITVDKSSIKTRAKKLSVMPSMKGKLIGNDLRDVIEYLSTLKY